MCLGIPAKVVSVQGTQATLDLRGTRRIADASMVPVHPGDYVIVYTGLIVERLDPQEAAERLKTLEDLERPDLPS